MDGDLGALCQACGLCCDGSLFGRVPLEAAEVDPARRRGLRVLDDGRAFEQPCSALSPPGAPRTCSVYDARPAACREFVCRLFDRHRREGGPLAPRLASVRRVREIVEMLQAEGLSPSDFDEGAATSPSDAARLLHAELLSRLDADFARASSPSSGEVE